MILLGPIKDDKKGLCMQISMNKIWNEYKIDFMGNAYFITLLLAGIMVSIPTCKLPVNMLKP